MVNGSCVRLFVLHVFNVRASFAHADLISIYTKHARKNWCIHFAMNENPSNHNQQREARECMGVEEIDELVKLNKTERANAMKMKKKNSSQGNHEKVAEEGAKK